MKLAGAGIIIDENKRILLTKRSNLKKIHPNHWCLPGGGNEDNETIEETAIREVKEEVGLDFIIKKLYLKDINGEYEVYRYLGTGTGNITLQIKECNGYGWFRYEEAINLKTYKNIRNLLKKLFDDGFIL